MEFGSERVHLWEVLEHHAQFARADLSSKGRK
jgi:hypothetical protein